MLLLVFLGVSGCDSCGEAACWDAVREDVGEGISGTDVLVAFFFTACELFHDGFLSNLELVCLEILFVNHGFQSCLLLINDFIQNHLQILTGIASFLLNTLYLTFNPYNLIIFFSDINILPFHSIFELIRREEKLAKIEWLLLVIDLGDDLLP